MTGIRVGARAGIAAYRESAFTSTTGRAGDLADFASYASRSVRYTMYWALYENSVYRSTNLHAAALKADLALYRSIRAIYNPSYRLGEFWATHLMGGSLDPMAGDGDERPSALPIAEAASPALHNAVAQLWKDSNWQTGKAIWGRYGAILGDAPMEVCNDPVKGRVTLVPVDPRKVTDFVLDAGGNVRGYTIEEMRPDPRLNREGRVRYMRTVERGAGEAVVYRTYLDESPYAWGPEGSEWVLPYGFVPFVWAQHLNVGAGAGWSELHAERSKIFELDDQASALHDHVRRMSKAPYAIAANNPNRQAVTNPGGSVVTVPRQPTGPVGQYVDANGYPQRTDPARDEQPIIWLGEAAGAVTPMVTNLNIADVVANIASLAGEIERDFPELRFDRLRASGDASGEALRIARQPAEAKVYSRRTSYDDALVRAHQMALAIGGFETYPGYEGFGLESYAAGALDHRIGDRPVFGLDEIDRLADETARFTAVKAATDAGLPLAVAMRRAGFGDDEIQLAQAEKVKADAKAEAMAEQAAQANPAIPEVP
jgi:hypothetical protein